MKSTLIFISLIFINILNSFSQVYIEYQYDEKDDLIYFEKTLEFEGKSIDELKKGVKKYLAIERFSVSYEDEDEIHAMGTLQELKLRKIFLIFFNTDLYNGVYDLKILFKENKIKVFASNFYLIPKQIKLTSYSWMGAPSQYGSGSMTTSKIPSEVPKYHVEIHYPRKSTPRHLLFPMLNERMSSNFSLLSETIIDKQEDW